MPLNPRKCLDCRHFRNDAAFFEATFKGLPSFSSGDASVRSDDGLCQLHDRLVGAANWCKDFDASTTPP